MAKSLFLLFKSQQALSRVHFGGIIYVGNFNLYFSDIDEKTFDFDNIHVNMLHLHHCDNVSLSVDIYDYSYDYFKFEGSSILFYRDGELKEKFNFQ